MLARKNIILCAIIHHFRFQRSIIIILFLCKLFNKPSVVWFFAETLNFVQFDYKYYFSSKNLRFARYVLFCENYAKNNALHAQKFANNFVLQILNKFCAKNVVISWKPFLRSYMFVCIYILTITGQTAGPNWLNFFFWVNPWVSWGVTT